jgi:hypothetical protein
MFAALDFRLGSPQFTTYLAVGGAVVIALALALYAVPGTKVKVPAIMVSIVGALGVGLAGGIVLMGMMGYEVKPDTGDSAPEANAAPQGPPGEGGGRGRGAPMGRGMGAGGGGRGGPNSRTQLANLVDKLDTLTAKPLEIRLTDSQRKEVKETLKGLDGEELSEEEAKEKLDKLQDVLKEQKSTLEAAGYRFPGEGGGGGGRGPGGGQGAAGSGRAGPPPPTNPFKADQNAKHLKSLTERLDKGTAG